MPNLFVFRGLKNKPKFRYFVPKFSLLFQQVRGRVGRVSSSAELDRRFGAGSRKTFEKVLSKLSKRGLGLNFKLRFIGDFTYNEKPQGLTDGQPLIFIFTESEFTVHSTRP